MPVPATNSLLLLFIPDMPFSCIYVICGASA